MSPQAEEMDRFAAQVIEPMRARDRWSSPDRAVKRRFDKMHGLGNDFVIVDARERAVRRHASARHARSPTGAPASAATS